LEQAVREFNLMLGGCEAALWASAAANAVSDYDYYCYGNALLSLLLLVVCPLTIFKAQYYRYRRLG